MINTKLKTGSIAMALTLLSVALTGCIGAEESAVSPEQPENSGELSEWGVYYTASISDLPDCTDEHFGKLYYIGEDYGFVTCSDGIWEEISLTGGQGPQGPAGAKQNACKNPHFYESNGLFEVLQIKKKRFTQQKSSKT